MNKSEDARIILNEGLSLHRNGDLLAAKIKYQQALQLQKENPDALHFLGVIAAKEGEFKEAVELIAKSIHIQPDNAMAHVNIGNALNSLNLHAKARQACTEAIRLKPDYANAYLCLGNALKGMGLIGEAMESFDKAIELNPGQVDVHFNRGVAWLELAKPQAAIADFELVESRNPAYPLCKGLLLHAKMLCCDWHRLAELHLFVETEHGQGRLAIDPFSYQGIASDEAQLKLCAEIFSRHKNPEKYPAPPSLINVGENKIKIAYLCGEFREQATSCLMTQLWELHDREKFEIYAFDNGWDDGSPRRRRINHAFSSIFDISGMSDEAVCDLLRQSEIDILINLNGFFGRSRTGVFAMRPCGIQVNYLGFPGTMGASYIDYIVADPIVIPASSQDYYAEKIVYMPGSYQVNDGEKPIAEKKFTRQELGLPVQGTVFCCFNNSYKILPATFSAWMRILAGVKGSVLWLLAPNPEVIMNLRREAVARGVDASRLIFAPQMPNAEHLARHRSADLFLDTLPYNAHTTASDALWTGLPVLTCQGSSFAGRVAASLLHALEMPELIAPDCAQYTARAIELGNAPAKLAAIKEKLKEKRLTASLFDTRKYARHLEDAYCQMLARHRAGLPPEHLHIQA